MLLTVLIACQNAWDDHYGRQETMTDAYTVWSGDAESYIKGQTNLSQIALLLEAQGMFERTSPNGGYTFIVYDNALMSGLGSTDPASFASQCVSDVSIDPGKLQEGFGLYTRLGKNIWVNTIDGQRCLDEYPLVKVVKTSNGYVYQVGGLIPIRPSIYDRLQQLDSSYSDFVSLVKRYEESYFDKENSTPKGVDPMGNTVYDSVMNVRNILMDRYTADGLKKWDMRSEDYVSTLFIPSNQLIRQAIQAALDSIPRWLGRVATDADREKFERWLVRACFVNKRLEPQDVSPQAGDFYSVDGYQRIIDKTQDAVTYQAIDPARWRPSVQTVDLNSREALSNGVAYYLTQLKIPNHVVIYRVKAKFYELWGAMTEAQKSTYFRWTNWVDQMIVNDAQSEFTLSETLPTMYYHVLTAIPSPEALADSLVCRVSYDGVLYNSNTRKLSEVNLPAGEYYLRMGFKHSLRYCINIWFNDSLLVEDMLLYAQGSNFHFDRGSVSDMDYYGSSTIGFPEGYNWRDWIEKNEKAVAYDTDGYQVAVVNLPKSGNFTITIESNDMSYLYDPTNGRSKNNVTQLMMYHWCLRPTINNY
ncbi:MAG TPA: hypothetical protein DD409_06135 [Bacteroidales bacterium]|nr:hypothetical protein [Bacteroidales bacterium]